MPRALLLVLTPSLLSTPASAEHKTLEALYILDHPTLNDLEVRAACSRAPLNPAQLPNPARPLTLPDP